MAETALQVAFGRAGVTPAEQRLREIALRAMVEHADNTFATCDAIWAEVQRSPALMAELFKHGWRREVSGLMHRVRTDIAYAQRVGALSRPIERKAAAVVDLIRREEDRQEAEDQREQAAAQAEFDREHQARLAAWRQSRVGSIVINDRPVWESTVGTVRVWLSRQTQQLRTVELLIAGVPDDGRPIGYYRKPGEVEALWRQAGDA